MQGHFTDAQLQRIHGIIANECAALAEAGLLTRDHTSTSTNGWKRCYSFTTHFIDYIRFAPSAAVSLAHGVAVMHKKCKGGYV